MRLGDVLVPRVGIRAAFGRHRAQERVDQEEGSRDLPAPEIPRPGAAPCVRRQACAGRRDDPRHLFDCRGLDARFTRSELERVLAVPLFQCALEVLERRLDLRMHRVEILLPVPPSLHDIRDRRGRAG